MSWRLKSVTESLFHEKFIIVNKSLTSACGTARQHGLQLWQLCLESLMKLLIIIIYCYLISHAHTMYMLSACILYREYIHTTPNLRNSAEFEYLKSLRLFMLMMLGSQWGALNRNFWAQIVAELYFFLRWVFCKCNKNFLYRCSIHFFQSKYYKRRARMYYLQHLVFNIFYSRIWECSAIMS